MIKVSALEIFERFNDSPKEQLELAQLIFRCGIRGDEIKSDNLAVDIAAKAILKDSFLSRENYKQRCERTAKYGILGKEYGAQGKEYGIQGKEYGIQGKEFGKLGGRPRKGETKEEYNERKRLENESLVSEEKGEDSQWTKMFNEIKQDKEIIRQIKDATLSDEIINDFAKRYGAETALSVIRWILEKYNV